MREASDRVGPPRPLRLMCEDLPTEATAGREVFCVHCEKGGPSEADTEAEEHGRLTMVLGDDRHTKISHLTGRWNGGDQHFWPLSRLCSLGCVLRRPSPRRIPSETATRVAVGYS